MKPITRQLIALAVIAVVLVTGAVIARDDASPREPEVYMADEFAMHGPSLASTSDGLGPNLVSGPRQGDTTYTPTSDPNALSAEALELASQEWVAYHNKEYGFSFEHPKSVDVREVPPTEYERSHNRFVNDPAAIFEVDVYAFTIGVSNAARADMQYAVNNYRATSEATPPPDSVWSSCEELDSGNDSIMIQNYRCEGEGLGTHLVFIPGNRTDILTDSYWGRAAQRHSDIRDREQVLMRMFDTFAWDK